MTIVQSYQRLSENVIEKEIGAMKIVHCVDMAENTPRNTLKLNFQVTVISSHIPYTHIILIYT